MIWDTVAVIVVVIIVAMLLTPLGWMILLAMTVQPSRPTSGELIEQYKGKWFIFTHPREWDRLERELRLAGPDVEERIRMAHKLMGTDDGQG
jgi:hypothetical protein